MQTSEVYLIMSKEDTYDITLISTIEVLLQKLVLRTKDQKRKYRLDRAVTELALLEALYKGCIHEDFSTKAEIFDDRINSALKELQSLI